MRAFKQFLLALIGSTMITAISASVISSQRVINALNDIGGQIGIGDRMSMTFYDIAHFAPLYGLFILFGFLIAMLTAKIVSDHFPEKRNVVFICAGATSMLVMLLLMQMVFFGVPIVAGARDGFGLFLQCLCGALGGYIFYRLF